MGIYLPRVKNIMNFKVFHPKSTNLATLTLGTGWCMYRVEKELFHLGSWCQKLRKKFLNWLLASLFTFKVEVEVPN